VFFCSFFRAYEWFHVSPNKNKLLAILWSKKMPPTLDEVHAHFLETKETYADEKGVSKVLINVKCNHCNRCFVFRNVQQLVCHLAAPSSGLGKDFACASVPPAVRVRYAERMSRYEEEKKSKASKERCRVASESLELESKKKAKILLRVL